MGLPIPKNMMIQSSGRSLSIDFFSDDEVQKILQEISNKINTDKKRIDKHKRYFLLVEFLYRTGGRIDEVLLVKPSDVNLATNSIKMKTLKQGKDKDGIQREKYRVIPLHFRIKGCIHAVSLRHEHFNKIRGSFISDVEAGSGSLF